MWKPANSDPSSPSQRSQAGIYADPLVYDVLHAEDTARDARVVEKLVRRYVPGAATASGLRLLEPASGSGRYLLALAKRGHTAIGIDLDAGMLAFAAARAKALAARSPGLAARVKGIRADMRGFPAPRPACHAAFNPINSIRHLLSDAAMLAHFAAIGRSLRPGGIYIVGIELIDRETQQTTEDVWSGKRGKLSVHQLISYLTPDLHGGHIRREQVVSSITVSHAGIPVRQIDSTYWLRTYTPGEWSALLQKAGWTTIAQHASSGAAWSGKPFGYRLFVLRPA